MGGGVGVGGGWPGREGVPGVGQRAAAPETRLRVSYVVCRMCLCGACFRVCVATKYGGARRVLFRILFVFCVARACVRARVREKRRARDRDRTKRVAFGS